MSRLLTALLIFLMWTATCMVVLGIFYLTLLIIDPTIGSDWDSRRSVPPMPPSSHHLVARTHAPSA
jgi:hypothetical protein